MKKALILLFAITLICCDSKPVKSQQEIISEQTKEIVLKAFNAQVSGNVELWKSLLSDKYTYTLNGQLDISKSYNWDELMKMQADFGKRIKGTVGVDFHEIIVDGNKAVLFATGKMEGVGGKYENDYAFKYELDEKGKILSTREWLSDILFATQMYGLVICGEKKTL